MCDESTLTLSRRCLSHIRRNGVPAELPVERPIASELPERFGLILDAWTHSSEHYLAVFGCYEIGGKVKMPLLCMAPLLNEPNDDLSAVAHREFLAEMLPRDFGRQLYQCVFILRTSNQPAKLRLKTDLRPPSSHNMQTISPDFESGCVCVLRGKGARLTRAEKATLEPFALSAIPAAQDAEEDENESFVERF
ncbi:hypothetical protein GQ600_11941 [Phytophthora cactorum]|nr:hypothetical protein GQ600_11941 [Phytophthora cactorum]